MVNRVSGEPAPPQPSFFLIGSVNAGELDALHAMCYTVLKVGYTVCYFSLIATLSEVCIVLYGLHH